MKITAPRWMAIRQVWLRLAGRRTCRKCGLFRVEAQIVKCSCDWAWRDANVHARLTRGRCRQGFQRSPATSAEPGEMCWRAGDPSVLPQPLPRLSKRTKGLGHFGPNPFFQLAPLPGHISNHVSGSTTGVSTVTRASLRPADRGIGQLGRLPFLNTLSNYASLTRWRSLSPDGVPGNYRASRRASDRSVTSGYRLRRTYCVRTVLLSAYGRGVCLPSDGDGGGLLPYRTRSISKSRQTV